MADKAAREAERLCCAAIIVHHILGLDAKGMLPPPLRGRDVELLAPLTGLLLAVVLIAAAVWILRRTADGILQLQLRHLRAASREVRVERVDTENLRAAVRYREQTLVLDISRQLLAPQYWSVTLEAMVDEPALATLWLVPRSSEISHPLLGTEPQSSGDAAFDAAIAFGGRSRLAARIAQDPVLRAHIRASGVSLLRLQEGRLQLSYRAAAAVPRVPAVAWSHALEVLAILARPD